MANRTYTDPFLQRITLDGDIPCHKSHDACTSLSILKEPITLPKLEEIKYWVVTAIVLVLVRRFVEKNLLKPVGVHLGISPRVKSKLAEVPILERFYRSNRKPTQAQISDLSNEAKLERREVERWLRRRRAWDGTSKLIKFSESGWRFICYVVSTSIGIFVIWDKEWRWSDAPAIWRNYPYHDISPEMRLYFTYSAGFYLSLLLTQAFDVKRKDFWEMFLHHIITLILLTTSWKMNFTRIGALVLLLHDVADVFLEGAKMANYAKRDTLSVGIFSIFTVVWGVTRIYIFPKKLIWEIGCYSVRFGILPRHIYYPMLSLQIILFCLHLFWTYFICKIALSAIKTGADKLKDSRSSTESDY